MMHQFLHFFSKIFSLVSVALGSSVLDFSYFSASSLSTSGLPVVVALGSLVGSLDSWLASVPPS
jgi:hypothetical protein